MSAMQDWIRFWLKRNDREFQEHAKQEAEEDTQFCISPEISAMCARFDQELHQRNQFPVGAPTTEKGHKMMNSGEPVNLLDRPKPPELSLNGAELSVNGSSPHIDDQPPEPPADPDGYPMKDYHVEVTLETGEWTDGWAFGRCEDAELIDGDIVLCFRVEAHNDADALAKAVTAAKTAIHNASTATQRFEPTQLKRLDGDEPTKEQLLHDRKPPLPWTVLSPAEIERCRRGEMDLPRWSSGDVNGAECWAVTVVSVQITYPQEQFPLVRHGGWLPASGSG